MNFRKVFLAATGLLVLPAAALLAQSEQPQIGQMWVTWIGSVAALLFALVLALGVLKKEAGTAKMQEISKAVQVGALAYLKQQYKVVGLIFVRLKWRNQQGQNIATFGTAIGLTAFIAALTVLGPSVTGLRTPNLSAEFGLFFGFLLPVSMLIGSLAPTGFRGEMRQL